MNTIVEVILPIALVVLIGLLVVRTGFVDRKTTEGISNFAFNITLPLLLFHSLATTELPRQIEWRFFFAYYLVVPGLFLLGGLVGRWGALYDRRGQGIFGLGASYSNLGILGLPVVLGAFGESGALPMFLLMSAQSTVLFSLVTLVMEMQGVAGRLRVFLSGAARGVVTNPIIISLMLGLLFNLLGLSLPKPLERAVVLLGDTALPTALFAVGATLSHYRLAGHYREALALSSLKLIVQPLLVWLLAFGVFHVDATWGAVAVVAAGMPTGINTYLFAQRYDVAIEPVASTIVLSTVLSLATIPLILAWFA